MLRAPEGRPIFEATNEFRKNLATSTTRSPLQRTAQIAVALGRNHVCALARSAALPL